MKSPFAQPEKSRAANVTIAKSRASIAQILRMLRNKSGDLITTLSLGNPSKQKSHRSMGGTQTKGENCFDGSATKRGLGAFCGVLGSRELTLTGFTPSNQSLVSSNHETLDG